MEGGMAIRMARPLLRRISESGPINPYAVAFVLTERTFRGPLFRMLELLHSLILIFIFRCEPMTTVGHSQVAFQLWRCHFGERSGALLLGTLSLISSYEVCCLYLEINKRSSVRDMLICYNGKPSKLYVERFEENVSLVLGLAASMRIATTKLLPA